MKKLKELVIIRFGINGKASVDGEISYIQGKDFDAYGRLNNKEIFLTPANTVSERDYLIGGEILFSGKGSRNYAVVWNGEIDNAVASSTFYVLTLISNEIIPDFLVWYLNSDPVQAKLKIIAKGATISNIPKRELQEVKIWIPEIKKQKIIITIDKLRKKENILQKEISNKKDLLIRKILSNQIKLK